MMKGSIRARITVTFLVLAMGPILVMGPILAARTYIVQKQGALNLHGEMANRLAAGVLSFMGEMERALNQVLYVQDFQSAGLEKQKEILSTLQSKNPAIDRIMLLDEKGGIRIRLSRLFFEQRASTSANPHEVLFRTPASDGGMVVASVRFIKTTGEPLITIGIPLFDLRSGRSEGMLVADIRLKKIWDLVASIRPGKSGSSYIVDAANRIVAHKNPSVVLRGTQFSPPDRDGIHQGLDGRKSVIVIKPILVGNQKFSVIVESPVAEAMALAYETIWTIAGALALLALIAGSVGVIAVRRIVHPIRELAGVAGEIQAGRLDSRARISSRDEIGELAAAFNSMTQQLNRILEDLRREIDERKRAEKELEKHRENLEEMVGERTRELEAAQAELVKREKLAVLGQLTATVSHELRNPLGVIQSSVYYLDKKIKAPNEKTAKHLNRIGRNVETCDRIIEDLLEYTRSRQSEIADIEVKEWIGQLLDSLSEGKDIEIVRDFPVSPVRIPMDPHKIRRVVINIMDNAFLAVEERRKTTDDAGYRPSIKVAIQSRGDWYGVIVEDNGIGMDPETVRQAFDPLYTTRARGTGLGLAIVRKIIEEHHGTVSLRTEPNQGARIEIFLPAETGV